jgi:inner membrane protein
MPSIVAHAVAGAALGSALSPPHASRRVWIAAAMCAALPDIDALGRPFGNLGYESFFGGHRGITHSLAFAIILGAVVGWIFFREPQWRHARLRLWLALTLATASHGVLDALSTIGNGVAFWAPFTWTHYEFLWRPLGEIGRGPRGPERIFAILGNELLWVGLPALIVVAIAPLARRGSRERLFEEPAA